MTSVELKWKWKFYVSIAQMSNNHSINAFDLKWSCLGTKQHVYGFHFKLINQTKEGKLKTHWHWMLKVCPLKIGWHKLVCDKLYWLIKKWWFITKKQM